MPRNVSGDYTLPAGNPVVSNTLIETAWANPTMSDIGAALTDSLDRYGRGGMLAAFKIADGTVTAPGLAFISQTNMGIYRPAADQFAVSVAAVQRLLIDTAAATFSVQVRAPAGTFASVPGFTWADDTNTGFWHPGADRIGVSNVGVQTWEFTAAGVLASGDAATVVPSIGATVGKLNIAGTSTAATTLNLSRFSNDSNPAFFNFGKSRGATVGAQAAVISNDQLGLLSWFGSDGTDTQGSAGALRVRAAENWTTTAKGGRMEFTTTTIGATTGVTRLTLDSLVGDFSTPIRVNNAALPGTVSVRESGAYGGAGANSAVDGIVLENNDSTGISILTPNDKVAQLRFGDPESNIIAGLRYDHALDQMQIVAAGAARLTLQSGSVQFAGGVALTTISANNYTPTVTGVTNIASITSNANASWTRIGDVVAVAMEINVDPTAASVLTTFTISLPVPSSLTSTQQLSGCAIRFNTTLPGFSAPVRGDGTDVANVSFLLDADAATRVWSVVFQYTVL
jgi:hypothetical protein